MKCRILFVFVLSLLVVTAEAKKKNIVPQELLGHELPGPELSLSELESIKRISEGYDLFPAFISPKIQNEWESIKLYFIKDNTTVMNDIEISKKVLHAEATVALRLFTQLEEDLETGYTNLKKVRTNGKSVEFYESALKQVRQMTESLRKLEILEAMKQNFAPNNSCVAIVDNLKAKSETITTAMSDFSGNAGKYSYDVRKYLKNNIPRLKPHIDDYNKSLAEVAPCLRSVQLLSDIRNSMHIFLKGEPSMQAVYNAIIKGPTSNFIFDLDFNHIWINMERVIELKLPEYDPTGLARNLYRVESGSNKNRAVKAKDSQLISLILDGNSLTQSPLTYTNAGTGHTRFEYIADENKIIDNHKEYTPGIVSYVLGETEIKYSSKGKTVNSIRSTLLKKTK